MSWVCFFSLQILEHSYKNCSGHKPCLKPLSLCNLKSIAGFCYEVLRSAYTCTLQTWSLPKNECCHIPSTNPHIPTTKVGSIMNNVLRNLASVIWNARRTIIVRDRRNAHSSRKHLPERYECCPKHVANSIIPTADTNKDMSVLLFCLRK
jgi:hypothetical protein